MCELHQICTVWPPQHPVWKKIISLKWPTIHLNWPFSYVNSLSAPPEPILVHLETLGNQMSLKIHYFNSWLSNIISWAYICFHVPNAIYFVSGTYSSNYKPLFLWIGWFPSVWGGTVAEGTKLGDFIQNSSYLLKTRILIKWESCLIYSIYCRLYKEIYFIHLFLYIVTK